MFQNYHDAVEWINSLKSLGMKPGLKRMEELCSHFNHPHQKLKFIHVAGTNGKGSTCVMMTAMLRKSGYDVGLFTSPYITSFTDRIVYNGMPIPEEEVLRWSNEIKPVVEQIAESELGSPTMFEVVTLLAILYFARTAFPDFVVWETGLGGRLDSTNIVHPLLSIITNVSDDHMDVLGPTISSIAKEKAGIIKAGVPVVTTAEQEEVLEVLTETAKQKQSTMYTLGQHFHIQHIHQQPNENKQRFDFQGPFQTIAPVTIQLHGEHQVKNAAAALMGIEVLRQYYAVVIDKEQIDEALQQLHWPGRMELVQKQPRIFVDGAHNPDAAKALKHTMINNFTYKKLHMMVGMLENKNHDNYFEHILPIVDTLIITEPQFPYRMNAEDLFHIVEQWMKENKRNITCYVESDWEKALDILETLHTDEQDLAVISGSLYLISDIRSQLLETEAEKGW
ncbi:bifunctional folylpolyglutamate synthase/dihydrofolate synthase [Longirhabdus pacifica]|uniref:bifunctional folylpolyglutamate synthase/dihydrofolate synthase n=1 Tax=Longirhabdus pacifica TaxID=2305227 RepID=UPI001F0C0C35|nr:folylpolyglutamate synthase/dihydrofolate synthase family protein [Longirhabdus pacifica]